MSRKMMECSSIWIVALLILVVGPSSHRVSAISCIEAITKLMPCQPFLLGWGDSVTIPCCQGSESLSQQLTSHPDELKDACQCIKRTAQAMGVDSGRAKQIPELCKITTPVPIDPNVDCDSL